MRYPGAVAFVPCAVRRPRPPDAPVLWIIIHVTDGIATSARATADYFAGGADGRGVGSHFVIGQGGEVVQCAELDEVVNHAHEANNFSVGIEHNARSPGERGSDDPGMLPTAAQYDSSAAVVAWLREQFPEAVVIGHNEVDPLTTHTDCPTGYPNKAPCWSWEAFRARSGGGGAAVGAAAVLGLLALAAAGSAR